MVGRRYLVDEVKRKAKLRVRGLLLYAVPNDGAALAGVASHISWRHRQLQQLCRDSDLISELNNDWVSTELAGQVEVRYVVAALDRVVDEQSARAFWGNRNVEVVPNRGHRDLVKPVGADDMALLILEQFVVSLAAPPPPLPAPGGPRCSPIARSRRSSTNSAT